MVGIPVVGKGQDGDAPTRIEESLHFQILGIHQLDKVFHDDVDTILVKVAMVAEAEKIEFQALALHHADAGNIADDEMAEVGLTSLGAQRGELRTVQRDQIFMLRVFVVEGLQHLWGIVIGIVRLLVSQQRDTFQFFIGS